MPNVLGLTLKEAIQQITSMSLNIGAKVFDAGIKDSLSAYVYKQSPNGNVQNFIGIGGSVDLYLTTDKEKIKTVSDDDDQEFDK